MHLICIAAANRILLTGYCKVLFDRLLAAADWRLFRNIYTRYSAVVQVCSLPTLSLTYCLTHSRCHSLTLTLTHAVTHSRCHCLTLSLWVRSLPHAVTASGCHSLTLSLTYCLTLCLSQSVYAECTLGREAVHRRLEEAAADDAGLHGLESNTCDRQLVLHDGHQVR